MTQRLEAPETVARIAAAASAFLAGLGTAQQEKACIPFTDEAERRDWTFVPKPVRNGLPLAELDHRQRKLAHALVAASTSITGYAKVVSVIAMEHVLYATTALESLEFADMLRDPNRYYFSVFGDPGTNEKWGWRIVGHHVSLNFTIVGGRYLAPTPALLGSEPSKAGPLTPLADDEEIGYEFVRSLDESQLRQAVIWKRSPPDFATRTTPKIGDVERPEPVWPPEPQYTLTDDERDILCYVRSSPKGLSAKLLSEGQLTKLAGLVEGFAHRLPDEVAAAEMNRVRDVGLEKLSFAWAGGTEVGQRHYFRVQGPSLLIEHDNTQSNGNHIHSVWRDPDNDFGDDLLAEHYRTEHQDTAGG